jgi:hypothetical protein
MLSVITALEFFQHYFSEMGHRDLLVTQNLSQAIKQPTLHYLTRSVRRRAASSKRLIEKLRQTPGIAAAGGSTDLPLLGGWTHAFTVEGYRPPPGPELSLGHHSVICGDYLQTMGIPLLHGRYFTEQDGPKSTHVLIVSESLAEKYWPGQNPLGKRLKWGPPE